MSDQPSVALIGAGAMGGALLRGWLTAGSIDASRSAVFDPAPPDAARALCRKHGVALNPDVDAVRVAVLVAALKPQKANEALPFFASLAKDALVISVMAGKSIGRIAQTLGAGRVARAMPNLAAAIGRGAVGLYAPQTIGPDDRAMIESLMQAAGETVWVKGEQEIDFVTAVSGSGPAYFFLLTEALAEAGETLGLSKEAAAKLALTTLTGAGAAMEAETRTPAEMRRAVTSPGGTTEAALEILDGDDKEIRKLVKRAVTAAAKRAGELTD